MCGWMRAGHRVAAHPTHPPTHPNLTTPSKRTQNRHTHIPPHLAGAPLLCLRSADGVGTKGNTSQAAPQHPPINHPPGGYISVVSALCMCRWLVR